MLLIQTVFVNVLHRLQQTDIRQAGQLKKTCIALRHKLYNSLALVVSNDIKHTNYRSLSWHATRTKWLVLRAFCHSDIVQVVGHSPPASAYR